MLLNEDRSAFSIIDFIGHGDTTFRHQGALEQLFARLIPEITANYAAPENYSRLRQELLALNPRPTVLVIGCGEVGKGMQELVDDPVIQLVNTDVSYGTRTEIICDGHDLPFADASFDGVIIQAVLEHVADPPRCVDELQRVLVERGIVYAETPFMQQVHGGPFDFTRYTCLGHRRLFRHFDEITSGATAGAALALAWSYQYFLLSFVRHPRSRVLMKGFARLTACWLRLIDPWIVNTPGSLDASLGHFFLGRKNAFPLSERQIISLYRGAGNILPDPASQQRGRDA